MSGMSEQQQPSTEDPNQTTLFPGPKEEIPQEVLESLSIVTGSIDPMSLSGGSDPKERLHPDFAGSKYEMLKKGDRVEKQTHFEDPKVRVLDLATEEGENEMSQILKQVGNPENNMGFAETAPQIMLDPSTPRGFRTIVVVRTWKARTIVKPIGAEAASISGSAASRA